MFRVIRVGRTHAQRALIRLSASTNHTRDPGGKVGIINLSLAAFTTFIFFEMKTQNSPQMKQRAALIDSAHLTG